MRLQIADWRLQIGNAGWTIARKVGIVTGRAIARKIGIVAVACLLVPVQTARAEVIERVLAVVAGNLITLSDVNAAYELGLAAPRSTVDRVRDILSQLIDRELQLAEAERYAPPDPTAADIDRELERVQSRFRSREEFDVVLTRVGVDLGQLRETLREELRLRAYIDQRFSATIERRQQAIDDWTSGLRRRADIIDLYVIGR
jgi:hypothetical protein